MTLDPELVRSHLKADDESVEDGIIAQYIASSRTICEGYCNRKFYDDDTARAADFVQAQTDMATLDDTYDQALSAASNDNVKRMLQDDYFRSVGAIRQRANGVVVDDTITAAMLLICGHLYFNRQEVMVSQYSGATQLPAGARKILEPYLWIGDLG